MNAQRLALAALAVVVLFSDFVQDWTGGRTTLQAASAAVRTLLLGLTIVALVKPSRPLVLLCLLALTMALVRRALFLAPLIPTLLPTSAMLATFHSGLDLAFRLFLLGWAVDWLRRGRDPQ